MPKPRDPYTLQLQAGHLFNHRHSGHNKPQISNQSKIIKLYTQQANTVIKLIKTGMDSEFNSLTVLMSFNF